MSFNNTASVKKSFEKKNPGFTTKAFQFTFTFWNCTLVVYEQYLGERFASFVGHSNVLPVTV